MAQANEDQIDLHLVTFEYPPLFHTGKTGQFSGTVGETVTYMCEQAGLRCLVEVLPFKRAYQKLENKRADAIITIKVDKFMECCVASQWQTPWKAGLFSYKPVSEIPQTAEDIIGERLIVVSGMRSPYEFIPELDLWQSEKALTLFRANDVYSATRMFLTKRAAFLWGSEDFYWYFRKQKGNQDFNFLPLIVRPIVVWFRKDKTDLLAKFNAVYHQLQQQGIFDHKMELKPDLMEKRYIDAPFNFEKIK